MLPYVMNRAVKILLNQVKFASLVGTENQELWNRIIEPVVCIHIVEYHTPCMYLLCVCVCVCVCVYVCVCTKNKF